MKTNIARLPCTDVRTTQEKQEAALVAAFRRLRQRGQVKLLRKLKAIVDEDKRRLLNVMGK